MLKVYISPNPEQAGSTNGIGRVVSAQYKYLPQFGIQLVDSPQEADIRAAHIWSPLVDIDVVHVHGLEWTGDNPEGYHRWHSDANRAILTTARRALAVTVPSEWVAMPFRRDMRMEPVVIGHGLDLAEWQPLPQEERGQFILWNKNRSDNVCDPTPANELARRGLPVVSTFGDRSAGVEVLGLLPYEQMNLLVKQAGVYLATTKETFGIGTLEALAAGVPVLGYDFGGTGDLVRHKVNGYFVKPGDIDGLVEGYHWLMNHAGSLSVSATGYDWPKVIERYAELYKEVYKRKQQHESKVAVVITNYNYGEYLNGAIESALGQTRKPEEIIVVDDGSTDNSLDSAARFSSVRLISQTNQGVAAARNAGIAASKADYIICLDADDWLEPEYVSRLFDAMEQDRSIGVAYTGLMMHFPNGEAHPSNWPPEFDFNAMVVPSVPPSNCVPCAAMFRREMWARAGGYKQEHAPGEDVEFFLRGLSIGYQGKRVTTAPLFNYRMHEGSASRTKKYKAIDGQHPWMRDSLYPMAAPVRRQPPVRSYSEPVVSVIIPVGPGHTKFLPRALDSLIGQTFRDWEVIVVDDSTELITDLKVYPFARYFCTADYAPFNGKSKGAGFARNVGLKEAKAPLVLWLDADDWLEPDALEKMVAAYARSEGRYIYTDWIAVGAEGNTERLETGEYNREGMFDKLQHAVTVLMATEDARRVGGFDTALESWEDWDFFIKCAVAGICGQRLPEYLLNYRTTTGTRRKEAFKKVEKLSKTIRERYNNNREVTKAMAGGCCGGSADSILAAKRAAAQQAALAAAAGEPQPAGTTRMEFTGSNLAGITYRVPGGNSYVGSASPEERYIYAQDSDVDALLQLGVWRLA